MLECLENCDGIFLKTKQSLMFSLSLHRSKRRAVLASMIGSSGYFHFDDRHACNEFLRKAFHFISDSQRSLHMSVTTALPQCTEDRGDCEERTNISMDSKDQRRENESIISLSECRADSCSDRMPNKCELHLRYFQKNYIYERCAIEYAGSYNSNRPRSLTFTRLAQSLSNHWN